MTKKNNAFDLSIDKDDTAPAPPAAADEKKDKITRRETVSTWVPCKFKISSCLLLARCQKIDPCLFFLFPGDEPTGADKRSGRFSR